jgi:hypothetical protein
MLGMNLYLEASAATSDVGRFGFSAVPGGARMPSIEHEARTETQAHGHRVDLLADRALGSVLGAGARATGGVRWLHWEEVAEVRSLDPPLPGFPGDAYARGDAKTDSLLLDLGLAFEGTLARRLEWRLGLHGLAGPSWVEARARDESVLAPGPHADATSQSEFAWGGLLEARLRVPLASRVALALGYEALWLDGVLRADHVLDFGHGATGIVHAAADPGDLFLQALWIGIEVSW